MISRRELLRSAPVAAVAGALFRPGARAGAEPLIVRMNEPRNLETPLEELFGKDTAKFYVRSHFAVPEVDAKNFKLTVEGHVENKLELTLDELKKMQAVSRDIVLECAAQYLPPRRLDRYLRHVARISSGVVCLSADYRGYQGNRAAAHAGVRTFETKTWWRRKMREAGFARCEEDYFFFKE